MTISLSDLGYKDPIFIERKSNKFTDWKVVNESRIHTTYEKEGKIKMIILSIKGEPELVHECDGYTYVDFWHGRLPIHSDGFQLDVVKWDRKDQVLTIYWDKMLKHLGSVIMTEAS
jgi:hypothetical protein